MARAKVSEQLVAEIVISWLEAYEADVYQEVQVSGGVADIVARVRAELWIVEVKTSLSLALVAQAMDRRRLAHRVFVAAPYSRSMREVEPILRETGIGLLDVSTADCTAWGEPRVRERVRSARHNRRPVARTASRGARSAWLEAHGADVYQEVDYIPVDTRPTCPRCTRRACVLVTRVWPVIAGVKPREATEVVCGACWSERTELP